VAAFVDRPALRRVQHLLREVPRAGWLCALIAILNALCWSILTPPFQVPDEPDHFAYVAHLVVTHRPPSSDAEEYPSEEARALIALQQGNLSLLPPTGTISSLTQQRKLEQALLPATRQSASVGNAAGVATSQPPLYYLIEAIPYALASHASLLARLALMRLVSALFAGLTAMFVLLFAREVLPNTRAVWAASGLCVAFAPLLGFMSGAVNPDSLLFAVSAALFWSLGRTFRLGLTVRRSALIGALIATGLLTKLNFIGLVPGAMIGLCVLTVRASRSSRPTAYRALAIGIGIALCPVVLLGASHLATGRSLFDASSSEVSKVVAHGSLLPALSSTWQLFLPRLPGMKPYDPGTFTTREIWFDGFVGQYGWVETAFPAWVYDVALAPAVIVLLACGLALVKLRAVVWARAGELSVYASMAIGTAAVIGSAAYFHPEAGSFTQARYLLPLLALFATVIGLALVGAGRRWGAVLGAALVLTVIADDIFSQLLVISRYYG
jgi:4-amino-4-deoxy-L-arabinose transferase-like glycosyltransferase